MPTLPQLCRQLSPAYRPPVGLGILHDPRSVREQLRVIVPRDDLYGHVNCPLRAHLHYQQPDHQPGERGHRADHRRDPVRDGHWRTGQGDNVPDVPRHAHHYHLSVDGVAWVLLVVYQDVRDLRGQSGQIAGGGADDVLVRQRGRGVDAVRAAGVDPGGQRPVRERAIEAGALLASDQGLAAVTLEAVAAAARCSVHSVYAAFGGRDQLMAAIYQRYSPAADLASLMTGLRGSLEDTVCQVYRALARSFSREPRVVPAMLADLFSRPDGPASAVFRRYFPSAAEHIGGWLGREVHAGRLRPLPLALLIQQFLGPLTMHLLLRPAMEQVPGAELPDIDEACAVFADAFLRAAGTGTKDAASRPAAARDAGSGD